MGSTLSGMLGTQNNYQASNPYSGADFQTALTNQKNVFNSEWQQTGQLENQINGTGPNPAQSQYIQNTQNLAQQQATLNAQNRAMAPGAAARLSGQQAIAGGQQAAGNAATLQAQQQLQAQAEQNKLLGQMSGQALGEAGNIAQAQQGVNQINSGVAGGNQGAANQIIGGLANAAGAGIGYMATPSMPSMAGGMGSAGGGVGSYQSSPYSLGVNTNLGAARGGFIGELMKQGGKVPGRAEVPGDSPKNDTVHAMLSPDEIVVKRTAATSRDKAKAFIDDIFDHMESEKSGDDEDMSFGKVLSARKTANEYSKKAKKKG